MSDSKAPKELTDLFLTLAERLAMRGLFEGGFKPASREDERTLAKVLNRLDADGAAAELDKMNRDLREFQRKNAMAEAEAFLTEWNRQARNEAVPYAINEVEARFLHDKLPLAGGGSQAQVVAPLRDKIEAARDSFKKG